MGMKPQEIAQAYVEDALKLRKAGFYSMAAIRMRDAIKALETIPQNKRG